VTLLGAFAALAAAITYFFVSHPCSDIFPCHDSQTIISIERHELLLRAKREFDQYQASPFKPKNEAFPRPLQVRIAGGADATIVVDGPIASNALYYAHAWYDVYHQHHGGNRTVSLRVEWKSGVRIQPYPADTI
jgi:hypothetical protein